jgi:hypothetical protein
MLRAALALTLLAAPAAALADIAYKQSGTTLEITAGGRPLTVYRFGTDAPKPFFWPIAGPFGKPVTRAYPNLKDVDGEMKDHPHHRGLHFTHGEVSFPGTPFADFWAESAKSQGRIVHKSFDPAPAIVAGALVFGVRNEWVAPGGAKMLDEHQTWKIVDLGEGAAMFVFKTVLSAVDGPVSFDDTKEGSFSIRVATSMDEQKDKAGPRSTGERGRIVNSDGKQTEKECWGKPADWVDYTGLVDGRRVGVAIFDHPDNKPRARWHVRAYGLFSANPFGSRSFARSNPQQHTAVEPGKPLTLRYGVLIHAGDAVEGKVAERWKSYLEQAR